MYVPEEFKTNDRQDMAEFMQAHSFAALVTSFGELPAATHLPFVITQEEGQLYLTSHMARANQQWKSFDKSPVLVIFSGPHAYISPSLYDHERNVPTWNYVAVHAYGNATLITDDTEGYTVLESMISTYEKSYMPQWEQLPEQYKSRLFQELVPFRIAVTSLQASYKLSQNKTDSEKQRIMASLEQSADSNEREIARYMKRQSER